MDRYKETVEEQIEMLKNIGKQNNNSYILSINGKNYGRGDLPYMTELFKDYVETCKMYGRDEVSFTVKKYEKGKISTKCEDGTLDKLSTIEDLVQLNNSYYTIKCNFGGLMVLGTIFLYGIVSLVIDTVNVLCELFKVIQML